MRTSPWRPRRLLANITAHSARSRTSSKARTAFQIGKQVYILYRDFIQISAAKFWRSFELKVPRIIPTTRTKSLAFIRQRLFILSCNHDIAESLRRAGAHAHQINTRSTQCRHTASNDGHARRRSQQDHQCVDITATETRTNRRLSVSRVPISSISPAANLAMRILFRILAPSQGLAHSPRNT